MGTCTGVLSSCAIAGYAMESRCHAGKKIVYDTVSKYGWGQDVRTHRIGVVIDKLLAEDWEEGKPVPDETLDGEECDVRLFLAFFFISMDADHML
jgi:lipase ATG15